ncbi:MAG: hypothetical protein ACK4S4_09520 [Pyrinomonadaceae bacterium]
MPTTHSQSRKLELIQWLSIIDDDALLDRLFELKEQSESDWWDQVSESERQSISKGIKDADAENLKPHSEAKAIYEKRL